MSQIQIWPDQEPGWLRRVRELDDFAALVRDRTAAERAYWISVGVRELGSYAAVGRVLGISDARVGRIVQTYRPTPAFGGWPEAEEILSRLYARELAALPPQLGHVWRALHAAFAEARVDRSWVDDPGEAMARAVEAVRPWTADCDQAALAALCRSWSRVQALAVADALTLGLIEHLPTPELARA